MKLHIGDTELEIEVPSGAPLTIKAVRYDHRAMAEVLWGPLIDAEDLARIRASRDSWRKAYYELKRFTAEDVSLNRYSLFAGLIDKLEKEIIE